MSRIAIIGTGISGLGAAYLLDHRHDVTVYEKNARTGGHSRTVTVRHGEADIPVDTGFIVFNDRNYPHFSAMLAHLGVATHDSDMTFAATIADGWLEWGAKDVNTVFGQRRNILRPKFHVLMRDVLRFNRDALSEATRLPHLSLGALLDHMRLGDWFRRFYILPMGGAIWSCPPSQMLEFPALSFMRFFSNHGLLANSGQPQWRTITGGSKEYVKRLSANFAHRIRTGRGAVRVMRENGNVQVMDQGGACERYDEVVFACHADEALALLGDANDSERRLLGAFQYQQNRAVLHSDESVMPSRKRCWASWVYQADGHSEEPRISVSYWMNRLQGIDPKHPVFVTLNPSREIAPGHIFDSHDFSHPVFDDAAMKAQPQIQAMQGARNSWFCGAHLRYGFHEDGLWSAVTVAEKLGVQPPWHKGAQSMPEFVHARPRSAMPVPPLAGGV